MFAVILQEVDQFICDIAFGIVHGRAVLVCAFYLPYAQRSFVSRTHRLAFFFTQSRSGFADSCIMYLLHDPNYFQTEKGLFLYSMSKFVVRHHAAAIVCARFTVLQSPVAAVCYLLTLLAQRRTMQ